MRWRRTSAAAAGTVPVRSSQWRLGLTTQIVLLAAGVAVVVAAIAGIVGAALIRTVATNVTRTYLADQADVIAGQLAGEEPGYRIGLARLAPVLSEQGIAVVTVGRNGVTSSQKRAERAATVANLPSIAAGGRLSQTVSVDGRSLLIEGRSADGRIFALVTAVDEGPAAVQRTLQRRVLWALAIGGGVGLIGALVVGALITRPLRRTAALARAMGEGARDVRAQVAGPQEVADVALAVNELAEALAHSEGRQRAFLASVSHELRTPLAAINGQGQALSDGIVPAAEVVAVGSSITAEAARLERLVSDLLDLARLGADSFRVELGPCEVTRLIDEMARVWRVRCDQRGVPLLVQTPQESIVLTTDARRLRQVLDGLADNALRLLTAGQPLVLAASADRDGVRLQVRDGGPGLAPDDFAVAFEPGVLHEKYRRRRPGGAGLGLALAASLVNRLGGRIHAGPAPEGGVAMTIDLPWTTA